MRKVKLHKYKVYISLNIKKINKKTENIKSTSTLQNKINEKSMRSTYFLIIYTCFKSTYKKIEIKNRIPE